MIKTGTISMLMLWLLFEQPDYAAGQVRVEKKPVSYRNGMVIPEKSSEGTVLLPGR
jgi:hypothetical protein